MLAEKVRMAHPSGSYLLSLENAEMLAMMCALVHFVRECNADAPCAEIDAVSSGLQIGKVANLYVAVAEMLIMRLQDALDDEEISGFGSPAGEGATEMDAEFKIVLAKAGKAH